jgi:hypothetical protein
VLPSCTPAFRGCLQHQHSVVAICRDFNAKSQNAKQHEKNRDTDAEFGLQVDCVRDGGKSLLKHTRERFVGCYGGLVKLKRDFG